MVGGEKRADEARGEISGQSRTGIQAAGSHMGYN